MVKMPRNIEIKARVKDLEKIKNLAKSLSGSSGVLIEQEDTFFNAPNGRLKLRELKVRAAPCVKIIPVTVLSHLLSN